ncbi:MAG: 16S rRNA (uracil1498-N3)-methyltransferase [Candidatus Tokpelaia sp. JSC161]|jgi:16S rRNA (uracil1498-N3)-methyltransferase|nr:MAG: 16S rRNA (uracil1498-N3)-methyltransferase [Candidatus Tokpelaia sp. JSC161]
MIQKAVEMGVGILQPIITDHTQLININIERIHSSIIEAAEQCGILSIPECRNTLSLNELLRTWEPTRHMIFCDESSNNNNTLRILNKLKKSPLGVMIGPEGGFSDDERKKIQKCPFVTTISLGPRILRADTAAVSAFTAINMTLGDCLQNEKDS